MGPNRKKDTVEHMVNSPSHRAAVAAALADQRLVPFFVGPTSAIMSMADADVKTEIKEEPMDS